MRISDWSSDVCSSDLRYRGSVARIADDHGARQIGINLRASTRIETVQHAVVRGDPDDRCARSLAVGEGRVCAGARERLAVEQIRIGCADIDRLRIDDIDKYGRAVAIAAAVLDFEAGDRKSNSLKSS